MKPALYPTIEPEITIANEGGSVITAVLWTEVLNRESAHAFDRLVEWIKADWRSGQAGLRFVIDVSRVREADSGAQDSICRLIDELKARQGFVVFFGGRPDVYDAIDSHDGWAVFTDTEISAAWLIHDIEFRELPFKQWTAADVEEIRTNGITLTDVLADMEGQFGRK